MSSKCEEFVCFSHLIDRSWSRRISTNTQWYKNIENIPWNHFEWVMDQWIYVIENSHLKEIFSISQNHISFQFCHKFQFTRVLRNFSNFMWNQAEIYNLFTQNLNNWGKLSFTDFTFHTNGDEMWNHVHRNVMSEIQFKNIFHFILDHCVWEKLKDRYIPETALDRFPSYE